MKHLLSVASALIVALSAGGCLLEEPLTTTSEAPPEEVMATPLPLALNMSDTLAATAPVVSLTGTWFVRQVNKDGGLFLGSASFLQVGRLLIGRIDWQNHPDGHLIGWVSNDVTAFGQGYTDTSKAGLLGFYAARIAASGDSLLEGTTYSNGNDSGVWVAARVSDCPALRLTLTPLPCQLPVDPFPDPGIPSDSDTVAVDPDPGSPTSFAGCWTVRQVAHSGVYTGTFVLEVSGDSLTGQALWDRHPVGAIVGTVKGGASTASDSSATPSMEFKQLFTGAKASLIGHHEGKLLTDGTLNGTTYSTDGGFPTGDSGAWSGQRTNCPAGVE